MPFRNLVYRPFTVEDVEKLKKNQQGIYALFRGKTVIYIGRGDIRKCLLAHLRGNNACIDANKPDRWLGRLFEEDPSHRLKELIEEYSPICNLQSVDSTEEK
jgi:hypothetical protein